MSESATMRTERVVTPATVLRPTKRCTVREQVDQFLIYSADTDEMHLVPPSGIYAYWLCDGSRSVGDVATLLADDIGLEARALAEPLGSFLDELVARRILEPALPRGASENE